MFSSISKNIIWKLLISFLIVSLMGLSVTFQYQKLITFGLIPFLLIFSISKNKYALSSFKNKYLKKYIFLIFLSIILMFQSIDIEVALNNIIQLVGVLFASIIILEILDFKKENLINWVLMSFVIGFYISIFFLNDSLKSNTGSSIQRIDRDAFDLNANKYSYYSFIANTALFYLIELTNKKFYIILSFLTLLLGITISFFTVSRSGFIFTFIIGAIYWLFIFNKTNKSYKLVKVLFVLISIIYFSQYWYSFYLNSYLKERIITANDNVDIRSVLAHDALNVFFDNPFTGLGPAQYSLYNTSYGGFFTHNSYLEAATNLGIIGFILVIFLFLKPLINSLKRKKVKSSSLRLSIIMYFFVFLIYNNFYVFYWSVTEMMFFFLSIWIFEKNVNKRLSL